MSNQVFISHSSKDSNIANAVCHILEDTGVRCWIAPRDIPSGSDWSTSIIKAIKEAEMVVLLFSNSANQSDFVYREVEQLITSARYYRFALKIFYLRNDLSFL